MKRGNLGKGILLLVLTTTMIFGTALSVLADTFSSPQEVMNKYGPGGPSAVKNVKDLGFEEYTGTNGQLMVIAPDGTQYGYSNADKVISAANKLESRGAAAANTSEDISNFQDITGGFELKADTEAAYGIMSGFTGALRVFLGILVVIISVGMTVYSGIDLCYIAFPVFRNKCEDAKQGGGGGIGRTMTKTNSSGETQLRFVSDDAQYAVNAAETVQSGQNPFVIYFKKRFLSYLVLAILLFILLTGRITVFTDIALKLVSGIIDMIQGI